MNCRTITLQINGDTIPVVTKAVDVLDDDDEYRVDTSYLYDLRCALLEFAIDRLRLRAVTVYEGLVTDKDLAPGIFGGWPGLNFAQWWAAV